MGRTPPDLGCFQPKGCEREVGVRPPLTKEGVSPQLPHKQPRPRAGLSDVKVEPAAVGMTARFGKRRYRSSAQLANFVPHNLPHPVPHLITWIVAHKGGLRKTEKLENTIFSAILRLTANGWKHRLDGHPFRHFLALSLCYLREKLARKMFGLTKSLTISASIRSWQGNLGQGVPQHCQWKPVEISRCDTRHHLGGMADDLINDALRDFSKGQPGNCRMSETMARLSCLG